MTLQGLSRICGNNIPGLFNLQYISTQSIDKTSFLRKYRSEFQHVEADFEINNGAEFLTAPVILGRHSYTENEEISASGKLNRCSLSVFLPHDSPEINVELSQMTHHHFIIKWKDMAGIEWTLGTIQTPCTFSKKFDGGTKVGTSKGYTLTWTCLTRFQRKRLFDAVPQ